MPRSAATTRRRILEAAYALFYREGFMRSGVDAIAAAAGVTKRTLYNHFPSKDDLIAAVLERQAELAAEALMRQDGSGAADPAALVRALFAGLRDWGAEPGWRGSGFTRAAMELAWAPGHPARHAAARHKRAREQSFARALAEAGLAEAGPAARRLCLLIEGAMAPRLIHGDPAYLDEAERAALALVGGAAPAGVSGRDGCA